ncbi:MAG: glycosyltransferase family 4 protein [Gammaproteobacteria bacterium]|nr:glycosyltransferase family 4 protein [Gammaproteobacteria bacterium]
MVKIINIHWGFSFGGVTQYAIAIDRVGEFAPINMMSVCIVTENRHFDDVAIQGLKNHVVIHRKAPFDFRWINTLRSIVRTQKPDLIITHGFNGHIIADVALAFLFDKPVFVATYHGQYHPPTKLKKLLEPIYNKTTDLHMRYVAKSIVSVAESGRKYLVAKGVPSEKIEVIHNGIEDVKRSADRDELRSDLGLPTDAFVVGVVSRLEPIKGIDFLLKAFSNVVVDMPSARLVIIGAGVQERELQDLASRLGITKAVTFAGFRQNASRYMDALDVFALPSLSEFHSIGLLEAMRSGIAIVATNVGGNTESIRDGQEGLIVDPGSESDLESALRRLFEDDDLRVRLGAAARRRFEEKFVLDRMIERTAAFLVRSAQYVHAD